MNAQRTNSDAPASSADAVPPAEPDAVPPHEPPAVAASGPATSADHGDAPHAAANNGDDAGAPDAPGAAGEDADASGDQDAAAPEAEAEAEPEAEAEAEAAPDVAAQEQEELWRGKRARAWHERTWLRVLAVLVVLTGVAAIIPYPLRITAECTIIPRDRVKVRAELPGVLAEILVDEGQPVKKGDVIARLDDRALKAERQKMAADLEKLQAQAATKEPATKEPATKEPATKEATAKEADRRDPGAPATREGAGASQEREAALKRARAELAYVDEKLAMTIVRAPIDGEILTPRLREHLHEGVEAGGLVCEIADTRRMRAEILIPEREVDGVAIGMPSVVKVESYPTHPFEGKVDFIAPTVDSQTGRIRVAVELDNQAGLLKVNMTGFGEVEADKRSLLNLATRRALRWIRVRFLL